MNKEKFNNFSVALGLFDFINPIFYTVTSITLIKNFNGVMGQRLFALLVVGCVLSIAFGLSIPTLKIIVGLGKVKFKMPVNLVFYVNSGILLSGIAVLGHVFKPNPIILLSIFLAIIALLVSIYYKTKKFNTIAVLCGLFGYALIYASLINLALKAGYIVSVVLYAFAICLALFLVVLGIKSNLKLPLVHWTLEITNVVCQGLVALSTVLLFKHQ